ncbi:MAG: hypothetical protein K0S63_1015 [Gammaproteobacteria bacterium]|jgi:hypothetical protein|nr:hypothetical protein [Gammaproteobacteria bacterium]
MSYGEAKEIHHNLKRIPHLSFILDRAPFIIMGEDHGIQENRRHILGLLRQRRVDGHDIAIFAEGLLDMGKAIHLANLEPSLIAFRDLEHKAIQRDFFLELIHFGVELYGLENEITVPFALCEDYSSFRREAARYLPRGKKTVDLIYKHVIRNDFGISHNAVFNERFEIVSRNLTRQYFEIDKRKSFDIEAAKIINRTPQNRRHTFVLTGYEHISPLRHLLENRRLLRIGFMQELTSEELRSNKYNLDILLEPFREPLPAPRRKCCPETSCVVM